MSIEITRGEIEEGKRGRYCLFVVECGIESFRLICSEKSDKMWVLLTPIGKPGYLGRMRDIADPDEGEAWVRWVAEQTFSEGRPLQEVLHDVRHSAVAADA